MPLSNMFRFEQRLGAAELRRVDNLILVSRELLALLQHLGQNVDRKIVTETINSIERAAHSAEKAFASADVVAARVELITWLIVWIFVVLGISLLVNVVLIYIVKRKNKNIMAMEAAMKDGRKKKEI